MSRTASYQVISLPNRLRAKVTYSNGPTWEEVERQAESDLANLNDELTSWVKGEADALASLIALHHNGGILPVALMERAYRGIHDIKGLAPIVGLPLVAEIAALYCQFFGADRDVALRRPDILLAHVDAIRATFSSLTIDEPAATDVLKGLSAVVSKALSSP